MTTERKVFLFLLLWSVSVLLLLSSDSPIHGPWDRIDTAILFTSGKALMSGMSPYVDFAAPHGPLLWLIYGIGYLLSPHAYYGVWALSCLAYACTFYYNYLTARLLLGDDRRAAAVAMMMPFFYFQYWFHDDVRAEDFCALFVSVSLYYMLAALCADGGAERPPVRRAGLVLGSCFTALLMIEYSIAFVQALMVLIVAFCLLRHDRRQAAPLLKWTAAGMAAVALPFIVYMLLTGTFAAFVNEYFVSRTLTAPARYGTDTTYMEEVADALGSPDRLALLLALLACGWFAGSHLPRFSHAPLLVSLLCFGVCLHHTQYYNYSICSVFLVFLPVEFLLHASPPLRLRSLAAIGCCILGWGVYENVREDSHLRNVCIWTEETREPDYDFFTGAITGDKPTVLYLFGGDHGYGLTSCALPAGKYWSYQDGSTPEMEEEHLRLLFERRADYLVVNDYERIRRKNIDDEFLSLCGYTRLCERQYRNLRGTRLNGRIYKRADYKYD